MFKQSLILDLMIIKLMIMDLMIVNSVIYIIFLSAT